MIQGKSIPVHYSNRRQKFENWLCNAVSITAAYNVIPEFVGVFFFLKSKCNAVFCCSSVVCIIFGRGWSVTDAVQEKPVSSLSDWVLRLSGSMLVVRYSSCVSLCRRIFCRKWSDRRVSAASRIQWRQWVCLFAAHSASCAHVQHLLITVLVVHSNHFEEHRPPVFCWRHSEHTGTICQPVLQQCAPH